MPHIAEGILHVTTKLFGFVVFKGEDSPSWLQFVILGLIFTAVVFKGERSAKGPHILSKQNSRPLSVIFVAHLAFLVIFAAMVEIIFSIRSSLPNWISTNGGKDSVVIIALLLMTEIVTTIDRDWLYRGHLPSEPSAPESSSEEADL